MNIKVSRVPGFLSRPHHTILIPYQKSISTQLWKTSLKASLGRIISLMVSINIDIINGNRRLTVRPKVNRKVEVQHAGATGSSDIVLIPQPTDFTGDPLVRRKVLYLSEFS